MPSTFARRQDYSMKHLTKWHWLILIALFSLGIWYFGSRRGGPSVSKTAQSELRHSDANETRGPSTKVKMREPRPEQPSAADPLRSVRSPLARRYLRFQLPGGRLDGESSAGSIVINAFSQAWGITARLELSDEQQDRLAEFLMQEDWLAWVDMKPELIEKWAKEHLSGEQQAALQAFIEESKDGRLALIEMRQEEPSAAAKAEGQKIVELLATDTEGIDPGELEKKRAELKALLKVGMRGEGGEKQDGIAAFVKKEQDARFYNLLADRIPLTEGQDFAVYSALREGAEAPINPYAYQSLPPERVEPDVRAATVWMSAILTENQYETYVRHFLAQIEMIRFQNARR